MYCVKCGVKLQDGETACPLCQTPVLYDALSEADLRPRYSDRLPAERRAGKYLFLGLTTAVMIAVCLACFILCMKVYGRVYWSGHVMLGLAALWIIAIFPGWFRRWHPMVFVPIDFAAVCLYLLYICCYYRQHWFLSFAFPVTGLACGLTLAAIALFRRIKRGRLYLFGGLLIAIGASFMLIELFQHITFDTPMFLWSLYCVCGVSLLGLFVILAAIIRPLREYLEKKFFL